MVSSRLSENNLCSIKLLFILLLIKLPKIARPPCITSAERKCNKILLKREKWRFWSDLVMGKIWYGFENWCQLIWNEMINKWLLLVFRTRMLGCSIHQYKIMNRWKNSWKKWLSILLKCVQLSDVCLDSKVRKKINFSPEASLFFLQTSNTTSYRNWRLDQAKINSNFLCTVEETMQCSKLMISRWSSTINNLLMAAIGNYYRTQGFP